MRFLLMIFFNWVENEYANHTLNTVDLYIGNGIKSYPEILRVTYKNLKVSRVPSILLFYLSADNIEINDISICLNINEVIRK